MKEPVEILPIGRIERAIFLIRGERVILAKDLARLYGVTTKRLNEQVKRNRERFPEDFMFQLTREEVESFKRSRSQFATLKRGENIKYLPYAFTEHGVIMAANVLNSERAVQASVEVVRTFVRLRQMLASNAGLARKLDELERRYDGQFKLVFEAIRRLMTPPQPKPKPIGFRTKALKR